MIVLLTGASGGIGTAIAESLRKKGYKVIGVDRVQPERRELFVKFYKADLSNKSDVEKVCSALKKSGTALWALIYCAGVYPMTNWREYTTAQWDAVHNVNLKAAFMMSTGLEPLLQDGGRIVMIASGAAQVGSRDLAYSASKAGLIGLTKSLALNLSPRILVNAVSPGVIDTPMSRRMTPERMKRHTDTLLAKRVGKPDEVAVAVEYLLDQRNSYMTGATIDVNGGLYLR